LRYSTVRSLPSTEKILDTDLIGKVDYATLGGLEFAAYHKGLRLQAEYLQSNVFRHDDLPELNSMDPMCLAVGCFLA
jgi:hypothetical protein